MRVCSSEYSCFARAARAWAASGSAGDLRYREEIEKWRQKRLADLKAEDGWLSVTGLYWLRPGETSAGSDPSNDLLLPDRAPGFLGTFALSDGKVEFQTRHTGIAVTRNGTPFEGGRIYSDADERPDTLGVWRREADPAEARRALRGANQG